MESSGMPDGRTSAPSRPKEDHAFMHSRTLARSAADLSPCDDQTLVALARNGDEAACRTIVQRYNRRLYRVARGVVRNESEAEDIVQETYVRAFTSLGGFRGDSSLSTWLTRIALNEALGRLRRNRPTVGLEVIDGGGAQEARVIMFPSSMDHPDPEAALARRQVQKLLEQAVEDLPEPFRIVFILRDIEKLSIEETAAHLSITPETVKTRLHRARRRMRGRLAAQLSSSLPEIFPFAGTRCEQMADRVMQRLRSIQGASES
jgi:RNA polymerase sigma-70 factor (ECF subfamily)